MIRAFCHTDDRRYEVDFDATPWFEHASYREITSLSAQYFGGDYAADAVAIWTADFNEELAELFEYANNPMVSQGFECHVDEEQATQWVKQHRPFLIEGGKVKGKPWGPKDWSPKQEKIKKPKKKRQ